LKILRIPALVPKKICIIDKLYDMGIIFKVDKNILKNSLNNAYKYNLSVYDGIFLATAQYFQGQLVTDDRKLFTNYSNKDKEGSVILLKDYGR
jgi:predicted nucleic acid-binding protein